MASSEVFFVVEAEDLVYVNQATKEELDVLPGIGAEKAAAIVAYREEHGAFTHLQDLLEVPGIGEKTLAGFVGQISLDK